MGWASGSGVLLDSVSRISKIGMAVETRLEIYKALVEVFEAYDWDTQDEAIGFDPVLTGAIYEVHPDWREEDNPEE